MELIHQMASVLSHHCTTSINVVGSSGDNPDLVDRFFGLVRSNPDLSSTEAAEHLYGEEVSTKDRRYVKLRERLIRRISNSLFFIDTKDSRFTDLQRAYYLSHREYALATILGGRGASRAYAYFHRRVYKRALRYELTDLLMLSSRALRAYYGTVVRDGRKLSEYNESYERALQLHQAESAAEKYFSEMIANYKASPRGQEETRTSTQAMLADLDERFADCTITYQYANAYSAIACQSALSGFKYDELIGTVDRFLKLFREKPFSTDTPQANLLMHRLLIHIHRKEFTEGQAVLRELEKVTTSGMTWLSIQKMAFLLAMHTADYGMAWKVYLRATGSTTFSQLGTHRTETWRTNRAYLYYLNRVGRLPELDTETDPLGRFRVNKFLNNVPSFSKEKRGKNISLLILQILFSIVENRFDESVERIEAIEKYCSRYIRRDENFRSNCFIKILLQFPIVAFHRNGVKRRAAKYVKMLDTQSIEIASQGYEVEIIPFRTLYDLALDSLEVKFQRLGTRTTTSNQS